MKLDASNNSGEYKVEAIWNNAVYARKSESGYLPGFYCLVSWKRYLKEENTWESASVIQHLKKFINSFYKDDLDKLTKIFLAIDIAPPTARPIVKFIKLSKRKQGQPAKKRTTKRVKKWDNKKSIQVSLVF